MIELVFESQHRIGRAAHQVINIENTINARLRGEVPLSIG